MVATSEVIQCLWCKKNFSVMRYGRGVPCPHCKKRLDIFPDPLLQIDTAWGGFTVSVLQPGFAEELTDTVREEVKAVAGELFSPMNILKKIVGT